MAEMANGSQLYRAVLRMYMQVERSALRMVHSVTSIGGKWNEASVQQDHGLVGYDTSLTLESSEEVLMADDSCCG